jgi:hypothetical protein
VDAEGWYRDPFEVHAERWFSAGRPTALVRDGGVESHDPPPQASYDGSLLEVDHVPAASGDDLKRAGEPDNHEDIFDVFGISQTGMPTDL